MGETASGGEGECSVIEPTSSVCPMCRKRTRPPYSYLRTDAHIRALGVQRLWREFAVCEHCYTLLCDYREIVNNSESKT